MGATPLSALSILGFPSETLHGEVMYQMMKGAMESLGEAGCALIGGHSIKDDEIKMGFAITGVIDSGKALALDAAVPGDRIVLTKPLGTGVLTFAEQIGKGPCPGLAEAERSMVALNRHASSIMAEEGVSACTDVTGFGLFGHLVRITRKTNLAARIFIDTLPTFEGAVSLLQEGVIPGAVERNREFVGEDLVIGDGVSASEALIGFDAQTSGGLLMFVSEAGLARLIERLRENGCGAHVIGEMVDAGIGRIELSRTPGDTVMAAPTPTVEETTSVRPEGAKKLEQGEAHDDGCCADVFGASTDSGASDTNAPQSMAAFGTLMQSVGARGVLDEKTKELVNFALVLLSRCEPCLDAHFEKAISMGITRDEIDEVAWCAIAMGGAPVKMFYTEFLKGVE
jgi:selenide,water dikinase